MKSQLKLSAISSGILAACMSLPALSAEQPDNDNKKNKIEETEVIEITGFRGSLIKSINAKRNSQGVVDSIHAEDVGKSTDQNIADALSRITGVTVQEEDGEGSRIGIRGTNANLNQIQLNGVTLTSGGSGDLGSVGSEQSVDLSNFSADILSSIDVQKTAAADQDEGSLGANVVLRTIRPLRLNSDRRLLNVEARYNQNNGELDNKISGSFSQKFLDDTLGIIVTATDEKRSSREDAYIANWTSRQTGDNAVEVEAGHVTDAETGLIYSNISDNDNIDADTLLRPIVIDNAQYKLNQNTRERTTATMGIQYLPTDNTELMLDLNYSKQVVNIDNNAIQVQARPSDNTNCDGENNCNGVVDPQSEWHTIEGNILTKNLERNGRSKIVRQVGGRETENKVASLNIKHFISDTLTAEALIGYSNTDSNSLPNAQVLLDTQQGDYRDTPLAENLPENAPENAIYVQPTGIDCSQDPICNLVMSDGYFNHYITPDGSERGGANGHGNILDPDLYNFSVVRQMNDLTKDTSKSLYLDFDWDLDMGPITTVEFGGKWSERDKFVTSENTRISVDSLSEDLIEGGDNIEITSDFNVSYNDLLTNQAFPVNNFMDGIIKDDNTYNTFKNGWGVVDPLAVFELMQEGDVVPAEQLKFKRDPGQSRNIVQTNKALYTKFNFELEEGRLSGNVGLRYVKTKDVSSAYQRISFHSGTNLIDMNQIVGTQRLTDASLPICNYLFNEGGSSSIENPDKDQYGDLPAAGSCSDPRFFYDYTDQTLQDIVKVIDGERYVDPALLTNDNDRYKLIVNYTNDGYTIEKNEVNPSRTGLSAWADRVTNPSTVQPNGEVDLYADNRFFRASATNTSDVLLPSLTINYALTPDLIGRVGLSKTMARPRFDDMRPSGSINETVFNSFSSGQIYNPYLKPLESKNFDLSVEWYFNETGLLSGALFYKDMIDFVQEYEQVFYIKDIRDNRLQYETDEAGNVIFAQSHIPGVPTIESILIDESTNAVPGDEYNCMPRRNGVSGLDINTVDFGCSEYKIRQRVNGSGSVTKGLELSYSQNYDFLPGLLSGLGVNMNYTYAHSENDPIVDAQGREYEAYPQPRTPRHSANATVFWEKDGLMLRLANRYNSEQLVDENAFNGFAATWLDSTNRLDFSSTYRINRTFTLSFQATNLTDDDRTIFMTSKSYNDINGNLWDQGNFLDNPVSKDKIQRVTKSGRTYRLGLRASF